MYDIKWENICKKGPESQDNTTSNYHCAQLEKEQEETDN